MVDKFESPGNNPQRPTTEATFVSKAAVVIDEILVTPGQAPSAVRADIGTASALLRLAQRTHFPKS